MRTETSVHGGGILVFGVVASLVAFAALTAFVSLSPRHDGELDPELSTIAPFHRECEPLHAAGRVPWDDVQLSLSSETWRPALNPCALLPEDAQIPSMKRERARGLFGWLRKRRRRNRGSEPVIPDPPAPESITRNSGLRMGIRF